MVLPQSCAAFAYINSTKDQNENIEFLNFQNNYKKKKKQFTNHDNCWQIFLPKFFSSVMLLHRLGVRGVFLFLLMKQYLQFCTSSLILSCFSILLWLRGFFNEAETNKTPLNVKIFIFHFRTVLVQHTVFTGSSD